MRCMVDLSTWSSADRETRCFYVIVPFRSRAFTECVLLSGTFIFMLHTQEVECVFHIPYAGRVLFGFLITCYHCARTEHRKQRTHRVRSVSHNSVLLYMTRGHMPSSFRRRRRRRFECCYVFPCVRASVDRMRNFSSARLIWPRTLRWFAFFLLCFVGGVDVC